MIVNGSIQLGHQLATWFTSNATLVLLDGQIVYCKDGANAGKYKIGDGTTALSSLVFYGGVSSSGGGTWGSITGTLSSQTDLQTALNAKEDTITAGTTSEYYRGDKTFQTLDQSAVGLENVDNTSDVNKPISSATQTALNAKEDTITAGTTNDYWRGDKSFQPLDKDAVGLGNVDNTSDVNKPISSATQTALNGKQDTITTGTTLEYFKGDLSLGTFPTNVSTFTNDSGYITSTSLTGYVPYTGATSDVDLDANMLSSYALRVTGTHGGGDIHLRHQSADPSATGQSTSLFADASGDLKWKNDNLYYTTLKTSSNTANHVYTFPDATGTVALTSDINTFAQTLRLNYLNQI